MITQRMFSQTFSQAKLDSDQQSRSDILSQKTELYKQLSTVSVTRISRKVLLSCNARHIHLHGSFFARYRQSTSMAKSFFLTNDLIN